MGNDCNRVSVNDFNKIGRNYEDLTVGVISRDKWVDEADKFYIIKGRNKTFVTHKNPAVASIISSIQGKCYQKMRKQEVIFVKGPEKNPEQSSVITAETTTTDAALKKAMECIRKNRSYSFYDGNANYYGLYDGHPDYYALAACLQDSKIPLPQRPGECKIYSDYKLYKSWYGFDYSSQYAKVTICNYYSKYSNYERFGLSTDSSYFRAPLPAIAGWISSSFVKNMLLRWAASTLLARVIPAQVSVRILAGAVAAVMGWFIGKTIDEGVGIFTSQKLSGHIGDFTYSKAGVAPNWMIRAHDWVAKLF